MSNIFSENQFNENQLGDALAVVGATIVSSVGRFGCVLMFSSWRALLLWSTFSGIHLRLDVAWDWRCSSVFNTSPELHSSFSSFFLFVFVFHLIVHRVNSSQAGLFLQAASCAGLITVCFFMCFFLLLVPVELFRSCF